MTLKEACQAYMDFLESNDYHEDYQSRYENVVFECALEEVFGESIWEQVRALIRIQDEKKCGD